MFVLLLISKIVFVLQYIKTISRLTKRTAGLLKMLMLCVKITAIFFSFCLFKLLNKFMEMPETLRKSFGTGKKLAKLVIYYDSLHEQFD